MINTYFRKNTKSIIIRQLQQEDKESWISFFQGLSEDTIEKRYFQSVKNTDPDIIKSYWDGIITDSISLIAEVDNNIVGCIELYINKPADHGEIAIIVKDEYQGLGIGSKLVEAIEIIAKEHKLNSIWFITQSCNMRKIGKKYRYTQNKYNTWGKDLK